MKQVKKTAIAEYYDGMKELPDGSFKISPSGVSNFFNRTASWYGENLLGNDGFNGNTASITGTIVHFAAEHDRIPTIVEVDEYLALQKCEYDRDEIIKHYPDMCTAIIADNIDHTIESKEQFKFTHLKDIVYVGGTYDAITISGNLKTLVDYKTTATKPSRFNKDYRMQMLTYAYILKKNNIDIDQIDLRYIVKATKTLPVRVISFIEPINNNDLDFIESVLNMIAESVIAFRDNPHLRHVISQDGRNKSVRCNLAKPEEEEI